MSATHPQLSRGHLEALLVATAIVQRRAPRELLRAVDRDCISVAAWTLLEQLADPSAPLVRTRSIAQYKLAERAELITVQELLVFDVETLLAAINAYEPPAPAPKAWERAMAIASRSTA